LKEITTLDTSERENAVIVGVITQKSTKEQVDEYLDELVLLADTAGADVRHKITQERTKISASTFIGSGKAKEIGQMVNDEKIDLVIFDDDLSPVQVRNLEKSIKCKILDRSALILDIFATRAKTKEAMTQVELAQLEYLLPRLTRQWTHLSKQYGGVGTKGPGETQIETDRRAIRTRLSHLKEKLARISKEREVQRAGRTDMTRVAMVGYTNAGKSTLLKHLSGADVFIEDRLFATLDTTVRKVELSNSKSVLLSDTVGFIRKLPSHLVASFRSTLAEASEADILLHVIDVSHPFFEDHIGVVNATLDELNAAGKPTIYVFNKVDLLKDRSIIRELTEKYAPSAFISADRGINVNALKTEILRLLEEDAREETLTLEQSDYGTIAKLHEFAEITGTEYEGNTITVRFRISPRQSEQLQKLLGQIRRTKG
jgi:GTP-binding protein HflX